MDEKLKLLRQVPYDTIKNFKEPMTGIPLQQFSKKDLCRLVYTLNGALYQLKGTIKP